MGPYNFTSSNIFGPSSIYIDICGNNGVIVSGTGGPARLNGPLISTANMSGAFLDKGYMVFTYRNPNIYRRHCGPAGVSFQMEVRCDQTTSQREEFSSSGHSFCNLMVTVWTASACPALPPTVPEDTTPFTDVWQPKTICRGGFERGIDLTSLYGYDPETSLFPSHRHRLTFCLLLLPPQFVLSCFLQVEHRPWNRVSLRKPPHWFSLGHRLRQARTCYYGQVGQLDR
jgi:hypothetical protein